MENKKDLEVKQEEVTTNQEPKKILEEEKTVQEPQQPQEELKEQAPKQQEVETPTEQQEVETPTEQQPEQNSPTDETKEVVEPDSNQELVEASPTQLENVVDVSPEEIVVEKKGIKSRIKKIIIGICAFILVMILSLLSYYVFIPGFYYLSANHKFESKEYAKAVVLYDKAGDFLDSKDKSILSKRADFYQKAEKAIKNLKYSEAAKMYAQAGNYKDSQKKLFNTAKILIKNRNYNEVSEAFSLYKDDDDYKTYAEGMTALYSNDFKSAIYCFEQAKNIEDSAERLKEANYKEGENKLNSKEYSYAQGYFKSAGDYSNAKKMIVACNLMRAESLYKEGSLNLAKTIFKRLPKKFSYKGISVSKRLNTLAKYDSFVRMCGKWRSSAGSETKSTQRSKSTSYYYWWTGDCSDYDDYIDVKCIIKENGKVKITGSAEYHYYTNFSSISDGLDISSSTDTINKTVTSVPNGLKTSNNTTITFSNGIWKLKYYKYSPNEDLYFNYTYEANYKYGKRIENY